ncbi:MAG: glycosyltransferase family 1 protein [Pseudomonadota bacterium]
MTKTIYYDISELFYLSSGEKEYYGIAKVVFEGARWLAHSQYDAKFVVFSQPHGAFFEIMPLFDENQPGGVDFPIPNAGKIKFTRRTYHQRSAFLRHATPLFALIDKVQRRIWAKSGVPFEPLDVRGGAFVSCARPKLLVPIIEHLRDKECSIHILWHDLIPLYDYTKGKDAAFRSNFYFDSCVLFEASDQLIANSHATAADIEKFWGLGELPKVGALTVAQLAHALSPSSGAPKVTPPDGPYFLMVGTTLGRKNLNVVLDAMRLLATRGARIAPLVLAGQRRKRTAKKLAEAEYQAIAASVIEISNPPQRDLTHLYENATAVILPSFLEGWGLPAAEGLWSGVPAICAETDVLREVCGDAGIYFDPNAPEALAAILERLIEDPAYLAERKAAVAARRAELRTWDDFGHDLFKALDPFLDIAG